MNRRFVSIEASRNETFGNRSLLPRPSTAHKASMASNVGAYLERFFPSRAKYDQLDADPDPVATQERWLKKYYFARVAFSAVWVALAFAVGDDYYVAAAVLLIIYPLWDAAACLVDAQQSGGLAQNNAQAINLLVSLATTVLVLVAVFINLHWVLGVYGAWAILSGLMQLSGGVRRWKTAGAQWPQILSGAQSALAGGFFIFQATQPKEPSIKGIAGYAAFGAFYFLISALWLTVKGLRSPKPTDDF
ncbi:hypothetical protein F5Y07DRAFT_368152 [Xylaria sp. FL0933]|nr:hypothetical protein F5Y07DRAFT_368152 [Xylaria sp. FL0933]